MKINPELREKRGPKPHMALKNEGEAPQSIALDIVGRRSQETWKAAGRVLSRL